jgi:hypothetical protein
VDATDLPPLSVHLSVRQIRSSNRLSCIPVLKTVDNNYAEQFFLGIDDKVIMRDLGILGAFLVDYINEPWKITGQR